MLRSLKKTERNRFLRFLRSPYHNTDEKLLELTELLFQEETELSRENLDAQLFPGEAFEYTRISNLLSYITGHLEDFWVWERLQTQSVERKKYLLQTIKKRELYDLFQKESDRLLRRLSRNAQPNEIDYFHLHWLELERDDYFLREGKRTDNQSLVNQIEALDRFYVISMLKNICQLVNRQNILQTEGIPYLQRAFIEYMQAHHTQYIDSPVIQAYFYVLLCLTEENEPAHYTSLKSFLRADSDQLALEEQETLYQYARNYCIKQGNQGKTQYLNELFDLYQQMLASELIFTDGYLGHADFKNIVALGVRLGQFDWTEQFLSDIETRVQPEKRDNALAYNRAQLYFARGSYRSAMRLLTQVAFEDVFYYPGAKTLLLKIYYELDDIDALSSVLHTFGTWLQRNRLLSPYQKEVHIQLIRFMRKLQQLRSRQQASGAQAVAEDKVKLLAEISHTQKISQKAWLEDKVKEL
ncbi:MAG: hypothetical protein AAFN10_24920 [Bacteroidota bacterium]